MRTSILASALAAAALITSPSSQAQDDQFGLVVLGDALEVCSSMAWQRCNDTDWIDRDTMRTDRYVNFTEQYVNPLLSDDNWAPHRREVRDDLREALDLLHQRVNQDVISERVFLEEFTRRATRDLYDMLSEREWNMIIDHMEMRVADERSFAVNLAATKDGVEVDLLEQIVSQAATVSGDETPHVVVVTAAQRDSLDLVNYYLQAFAGAGADASWLPLDAAVLAARADDNCAELDDYRASEMGAYRRAAVHGELAAKQQAFCEDGDAITMLENADAVYFADGDTDLLRALVVTPMNEPNALAMAIAQRVAENELVVAAAGMAANVLTAKAVVTGGASRAALSEGVFASRAPGLGCHKEDACPRDLSELSTTYHPMGGMGLFRWGTLDTRMGEQGNHGRLLRVQATNRVPFAVGIDAKTGMLVALRSGNFQVIGERGAFFAVGAQQNERAVAATYHYLMAGASGTFSGNDISNVSFAEDAEVVQLEPTTNFLENRGLYDAQRLLCRERESVEVKQNEFVMNLLGGEGVTSKKAGAECQLLNARICLQYAPSQSF